MATVGKRGSTHAGLIKLSLLTGIVVWAIAGAGFTNAQDKPRKGAVGASSSPAKTVRAGASQKLATQKRMRNPWEKPPAEVAVSRRNIGNEEAR